MTGRPRRKGARGKPRTAGAGRVVLLRLYVVGQTPHSLRAIRNIRALCASSSRSLRVEVIDLLERPQLARRDQIVAVPTVVRRLPLPLRRLVGDLSDTGQVLVGLDLQDEPTGRAR